MNNKAIGIFDSGVGGLTVLKAIAEQLPNENLIYLGDSARVPYGTKSNDSVKRYAAQASKRLIDEDIKLLVVACNTASAVALEYLQQVYAPIPVIGVIFPGASAAIAASTNNEIAVIATESTVNGGAYEKAILSLQPNARVLSKACSLFVALAEENWVQGDLLEAVIGKYLHPLFNDPQHHPDTLVLGCTHFPVLKHAIAQVVGNRVALVDSAQTTAKWVHEFLLAAKQLNNHGGAQRYLVTDGVARFARVAQTFLGKTLSVDAIELVDIS